jgi:hypothetical protein
MLLFPLENKLCLLKTEFMETEEFRIKPCSWTVVTLLIRKLLYSLEMKFNIILTHNYKMSGLVKENT